MKIAYGDPAYLGRHTLYPERTPVDHRELVERLAEADGWGLSLTASSLAEVLAIVVDVVGPNVPKQRTTHRVMAWVRPDAPPKPGVQLMASWEPVIIAPARKPAGYTRDWIEQSHKTARRGLVGAKPPEFCSWLLRCLGWRDGDQLDEVFPGTSLLTDMAAQGGLFTRSAS